MLSRVADAIYWMNRYIERAENVARFVDVSLNLALDMPAGFDEPWGALIATTGDDATFLAGHGAPTKDAVLRFLAFDRTYSSSIVSCLNAARENARSVREIISSEMWEQVNKAYLFVNEAARDPSALDVPHDFFTAIKQAAHLFVGSTYLTMTHNEGWHFGRLGRLLERADKTSRLLDVKYFLDVPEGADARTYDELQWAAVLKSASALEMYRKRHGAIAPDNAVEFLLLDRKFPRSVKYCVNKAERSLKAIAGTPDGEPCTPAEHTLGKLRAELEFADIRQVLAMGLHGLMDGLQEKLNHAGAAIFDTFVAVRPNDDEPLSVAMAAQ